VSDSLAILVIGQGRMGRAVAEAAAQRGHRQTGFVSRTGADAARTVAAAIEHRRPDVAIDFTHAGFLDAVVDQCLAAGIPLVTGTTGWAERETSVRERVTAAGGTLLHAANFSIGVRLFLRTVERAAELFGGTGLYDTAIEERHHRAKADAPSGTAIELARRVARGYPDERRVVTDRPDRPLAAGDLHVTSLRIGHEFGRHTVVFDGEDDVIELRHTARSRRAFATGAVRAAEWLHGKSGPFTLDDMIDDMLGQSRARRER